MPELPDDLVASAREFIAGATWTFAKTMADNPHWYVVIPRATDHRIDALLTLLLRCGNVRRWHGKPYRTVTLDGWDYWDIDPVINRKPSAVAGWDGDAIPPVGWLPASFRRDMSGLEHIPLGQASLFGDEGDVGEDEM